MDFPKYIKVMKRIESDVMKRIRCYPSNSYGYNYWLTYAEGRAYARLRQSYHLTGNAKHCFCSDDKYRTLENKLREYESLNKLSVRRPHAISNTFFLETRTIQSKVLNEVILRPLPIEVVMRQLVSSYRFAYEDDYSPRKNIGIVGSITLNLNYS